MVGDPQSSSRLTFVLCRFDAGQSLELIVVNVGKHTIWSLQFSHQKFLSHLTAICRTVFLKWLEGTPFICVWYRLLGADIGSHCWFGSNTDIVGYDLVTIGSSVVIEDRCSILASQSFDGNVLQADRVSVADHSCVCRSAVLLPGAAVGHTEWLQNHCLLPALAITVGCGQTVWPNQHGSIGHESKTLLHPPATTTLWIARYLVTSVLHVILFDTAIGTCIGFLAMTSACHSWNPAICTVVSTLSNILALLILCCWQIFLVVFSLLMTTITVAVKWVVVGQIRCGSVPLEPTTLWCYLFYSFWCRIHHTTVAPWFAWSIVDSLYQLCMGAKLPLWGSYCSDLTNFSLQFDLLSIGANTFVAASNAILCWEVQGGRIVFHNTCIGSCSYIGNSSIILPKCMLGHMVKVADHSVVARETVLLDKSYNVGFSQAIVTSSNNQGVDNLVAMLCREGCHTDSNSVAEWLHLLHLPGLCYHSDMLKASSEAEHLEARLQQDSKPAAMIEEVLSIIRLLKAASKQSSLSQIVSRLFAVLYIFCVIGAVLLVSCKVKYLLHVEL